MKKNLLQSLLVSGIAIMLIIIFIFLFFEFKYPLKFKEEIEFYAEKNDISPTLVAAIINTESSFRQDAKSNSGAEGLMQLLPSTARFVADKYGVEFDGNLFSPQKNIEIGCFYLKYLFDKFKNEQTVLFAYNSGEGNVSCWLNDKHYSKDGKTLDSCPFEETNNYVKKVQKAKKFYSKKISAQTDILSCYSFSI